MSSPRIGVWLLVSLLAAASQAGAQEPQTGRLLVSVADPSGARIPQPRVSVSRDDDPENVVASVVGTDTGVAAIDGLLPGRYTVRVEFPGFETVTLRDVRVRAGDNRRGVTLPIRRVAEDLTVGRDPRTRALDPRGDAFSTVLTREQIARLPDDPDEMQAMLEAMAPPGAVLRVDGFTGGKLPPKSQIRSIRLPRMDALAAQNHGGLSGMLHIDVLTQPGHGPLRGSIDAAFRDDALNARNPFTPDKGDEGMRQGAASLSGTIVPNRSSFSISMQQARLFDTGGLLAATPDGTRAESVRRPTGRSLVNTRLDQALGPAHALQVSYQRSALTLDNLGVGGFELPERAFSTTSTEHLLRLSENGPVGRRLFSESRLQLRWSGSDTRSAIEAPAIRVIDAFTSGGAQRRGGRRTVAVEAASDLDYVRGAHAFRTGVLLETGSYRADDVSNDLGTWTFASLADFEAGRPAAFTRQVGDPRVRYRNVQLGVYAQDDHRVRKSVMLSYGVRYEWQSLVAGAGSLSPRVSVTWSPLASGRTTFRAGAGYFTDWIAPEIYEQTLRVDGERQREINVRNPAWPEAPPMDAALLPANRYLLAPGVDLPEAVLANAGVEQLLPGGFRVNATYTMRRGRRLLRGRNLNAPIDGVRPDPSRANVVEVVGDAGSRVHQLGVTATLLRLDWRQTLLATSYVLSSAETNTAGAFALPARGDDLAAEWGPAAPRHRWSLMFNTRPGGGLALNLTLRAQSGAPYTVTTGTDDNGDGVFNDRPAGVGRSSARTAGQIDAGLRLSWTIGFGPARGGGSGGAQVIVAGGGGGGMPAGAGASTDRRFRVEIYAAAQNVANRRNFIGYSGVLTSPFFGQPTDVLNPRKVELGVRFGF